MVKKSFDVKMVKFSTDNLGDFEATISVEIESKDADPLTLQKIVDAVPKKLKGKPTDLINAIDKLDSAITTLVDNSLYDFSQAEMKKTMDSYKKSAEQMVVEYTELAQEKAQNETNKVIADHKKAAKDKTKNNIKVGAKLTFKGLSIAKSVASLVATMGGDITAYAKILKTVKSIADIIKKNSETLEEREEHIVEALKELQLAQEKSDDAKAKVAKECVKKIDNAVSQYETTLARLQDRAVKMSKQLNKLLEKDSGKDAAKINEMIKNISNLSPAIADGKKFAKKASETAADANTKLTAKDALALAKKAGKVTQIANAIYEAASAL